MEIKNLIGKKIKIIYMKGEPNYAGRTGIVTHIDDMKQLHGTWGGLAIIPNVDTFKIIGGNDDETV
jgi:hypothetical protein